MGVVTKVFAIGTNPNNNIYVNASRVTEAVGDTPGNFAIGDFSWDSTNSRYRIPISHIVSSGNPVYVRVKAFSAGTAAVTILDNASLSSQYTLTALSRNYENFNTAVGIGVTSPNGSLDVNGNIYARSDIRIGTNYAGTNTGIIKWQTGNSLGLFTWGDSSDIQIGGNNTIFKTESGTERMRIASGGNVGIGTTSPLAQLDIRSSTATGTAATLYLNHNGAYGQISALDAYHGLILRGIPSTTNDYSVTAGDQMSFVEYGGDFRFYLKNGGALTLQGRLNSGTWTVTGDVVAYGSPSDITLKTNIKPLESSLDKIMKLQGVSFTWKDNTDASKMTGIKDDIGFIAQDVQEILPELVRKNDNGLLSLRDKGITALLVEAIKEQQRQIENLQYLLSQKQN
jgi:hypothetical protein